MHFYVRAGAMLPLGPVRQYSGEASDEPMTLLIHPGADGSFTLYEDDGESFAYKRGEFTRFEFRWSDTKRTLRVTQLDGAPAKRSFAVQRVGDKNVHSVAFTGKPAAVTF